MISFVSQHAGQKGLDFSNRHGETALHLCSGKQLNFEIAKVLLLKGASFSIKNAIGDTPLKLA
jgi:ankyrin repeat protein